MATFNEKISKMESGEAYFVKQIFAKVLDQIKINLRSDMGTTIQDFESKAVSDMGGLKVDGSEYERISAQNLEKNFKYILRSIGEDPDALINQITKNITANADHKNYKLINNIYRKMNNELHQHNKNIIKEYLRTTSNRINLPDVLKKLSDSRFKGLRDIMQYLGTAAVAGLMGGKAYAEKKGPEVYNKSKEIISWLWKKTGEIANKTGEKATDIWNGWMKEDKSYLELLGKFQEMFSSASTGSKDSYFRKTDQGSEGSEGSKKSMFSSWPNWFKKRGNDQGEPAQSPDEGLSDLSGNKELSGMIGSGISNLAKRGKDAGKRLGGNIKRGARNVKDWFKKHFTQPEEYENPDDYSFTGQTNLGNFE
jgi:hypothetical protein